MCISRFGSFLETLLTKESLKCWVSIYLERANYPDYLEAEKLDAKITLLNTVNNLYRSTMALMLCYILTVLYYYTLGGLLRNYPMVYQLSIAIMLFLLFYYSFRKQTGYIKKRVKNALQHSKKDNRNSEEQMSNRNLVLYWYESVGNSHKD